MLATMTSGFFVIHQRTPFEDPVLNLFEEVYVLFQKLYRESTTQAEFHTNSGKWSVKFLFFAFLYSKFNFFQILILHSH